MRTALYCLSKIVAPAIVSVFTGFRAPVVELQAEEPLARRYAIVTTAGNILHANQIIPALVAKDYNAAQAQFAIFLEDDDVEVALVHLHQWVVGLLSTRREARFDPQLMMDFVITPLYASVLEHLDSRDYLEGTDFLSWYVTTFDRNKILEGYGKPDQHIFALFAHMVALDTKMILKSAGGEMSFERWKSLMRSMAMQRRLLAWLTKTKREEHFGSERYMQVPYSLLGSDLSTPFDSYQEIKQVIAAKRQRLLAQFLVPTISVKVRSHREMTVVEAYLFEDLIWIQTKTLDGKDGGQYVALTVDDLDEGQIPLEGTLIDFAQGEPDVWRHGTPYLWNEIVYRRFNIVLGERSPEAAVVKLGMHYYAAVQNTRWARGAAAINLWLDVAFRMAKDAPIPRAMKNLDCHALSLNGKAFLESQYLKRT